MDNRQQDNRIGGDAFWDMGEAVKKEKLSKPKVDIGTVLLELNKRGVSGGGEPILKRASEISPPKEKNGFAYQPNAPFLTSVSVSDWPTRYTFYARFRERALQLFDREGEPSPHVPFFSYMPQYSQLSGEQLDFYLYFRRCLREDKPIKADAGYVLLYLYELINLPEKHSPSEACEGLCRVWLAYRASYPKLDRLLSEWVADLCLIHRLPCPIASLAPIRSVILKYASLKEFYLDGESEDEAYSHALLCCESEYNFYASKYITEQNRSLFETHIPAAFLSACRLLAEKDERFRMKKEAFQPATQIRDAFSAALCAYDIKKKIEVNYRAYQRMSGLRPLVTDLVKYAENVLRARLGIKARMSTLFLDASMKGAVDAYFDRAMPAPKTEPKKPQESVSEFESLYAPRDVKLSFASAADIEQKSWESTASLVADFDSYSAGGPAADAAESEGNPKEASFSEWSGQSGQAEEKTPPKTAVDEGLSLVKEALSLLLQNDQKRFALLAEENLMMLDTLVECVNEFCYDLLGDVAVTLENGRAVVCEDYRKEIEECLKE
ncbi:MAG: hypothetical protein E7655_07485 [Ruminococcaceae bacterium]|nr:hypothetical protein [Oscillospiraceae bacterium]